MSSSQNMTSEVNITSDDCTNDYCVSDEDYLAMMEEYIYPTDSEWFLISMHIIVFVIGLVGNALVCVSVYRNHSMRTVTNYFIVNLAVADFLVILFCLPPTVLWDVTETWFFGRVMCKLVLYLQSVSVSVSVLTLTFISIDRWYAICHPLQFKSTASRAKTSIMLIWIVSISIALPDIIVLDTRHQLPFDTLYFTDCAYTWAAQNTQVYQLFLVVVLYIAPFTLMTVTYYQIWKVLRVKTIPGSCESARHVARPSMAMQNGRHGASVQLLATNPSCESQIKSRRKAAEMLCVVVITFGVCYFPVHCINVLRYTVGLKQTEFTTFASLFSHWFCYFNSCVNPVIYNIMNKKFRREFRNFLCCFCCVKTKTDREDTKRSTTTPKNV